MREYLCQYLSKLARNKIDTQVVLKEPILCGNTLRIHSTINY